jgi:tetratricopeptide (TPR) repeat protein
MSNIYDFLNGLSSRKLLYVLIILTAIVYSNGLFGEFLSDDRKQILDNLAIHSFSNFFFFFEGSTFDAGGETLTGLFYRPFQTVYFSLLWNIFGAHPFFFHFFQIIFHIFNGLLVFFVFKHSFGEVLAFFLSLIFLIHPMNVETVSYISSSGIILSFFFGLLAFRIVIRNNARIKDYILLSGFLLLAFLSHEIGFLFIPLILFFKFLYDRKKLLSVFLITIIPASVYTLLRFGVAHLYFPHVEQSPIMMFSLSERLLHIPKVLFFYFSTFFAPIQLSFSQVWTISKIDFNSFYMPLASVILLAATCGIFLYALSRSRKNDFILAIFFMAWLLIGLVLFIQIIPAEQTVAERWFYFPMVGLLGLAGIAIKYFFAKKDRNTKTYLIIFFTIFIILLSARSIVRNNDWRDEFTLAMHDIKRDPNNYILSNSIGAEYLRRGDAKNAVGFLEKSVSQFTDAQSLNNLGAAYFLLGENTKSKETFQKSLNVNELSDTVSNMAWLLATRGDPVEAEDFIQKKLRYYPNFWKLWMNLSIAQYKIGKKDEALQAAKQAYSLSPNEMTSYVYNQISKGLPIQIN